MINALKLREIFSKLQGSCSLLVQLSLFMFYINALKPKEILSTVKVEPNGEYVEPPQAKMSYATMVFVRTAIGQSLTLMMIQQYVERSIMGSMARDDL